MPTKIWYCPFCGYEVPARGRCHSCGERLVAAPLPELESGPDDDEVGYRLDQWDDGSRARLIRLLVTAKVPHRFEDEELVVLAVDEPEVDKLVERATGAALDDEEEQDEAPAPLAEGDRGISRALYEAARLLREDPTDMKADVALAEASAAVFAVDYLPDLDEAQMAAVGRVTRRLLGALGADEALEDEIRHQADVLCRLVALSAGQDVAQGEVGRAMERLEAAAKQKGRAVALPRSVLTPAGEMGAQVARETTEADAVRQEVPSAKAIEEAPAEEPSDREVSGEQAVDHEAPAERPPGQGASGGELVDQGASLEPAVDLEASEAQAFEAELEDEDEDTGEIVYELAEWLPEQRVELSLLAEDAGIPYSWEGTDLTVAEEHEAEVEALFGQVRGLAEEDDEARYRAIEELFGSVDRLANDPGDEERQQAFLQAVGAVEQPTPVGVDDAFWWRVRSQGHAVVAAIEGTGRLEEISREAALLAEMLHEMV